MKGPHIRMLTLVLAGTLLTTCPVFAAGAAQVAAAVEQSGVSREDREALLQEADRALKAGVPAADLEIIVRRAKDRGLPPHQVRELIRTVSQAGEQGLIVRPVLDRIQQGLAKGAPAELIVAAARRLTENLAAAGPLVDGLVRSGLRAASPADRAYAVETVARALEGSVSAQMIRAVGEIALQHELTVSHFDRVVRSLTLLVAAGVPTDSAGRIMRETIEHRFTDRDYSRLEQRVAELLGHGRTPEEIVTTMERDIRSVRGPGERRDNGGRDRGPGADRETGGRGRGR